MPAVSAEPRTVMTACAAMGSRFEFILASTRAGDEPRLRAAAEAAAEEVLHWHGRLSWFDPGSFVSHINTHAHAAPVVCDSEFFRLLSLCRDLWQASGGAFDPTIAALMRAAGFRGHDRDDAA